MYSLIHSESLWVLLSSWVILYRLEHKKQYNACNYIVIVTYLYQFHISSYPLSQSHYDTLNSYNISHSTWGVYTFRIYNSFPYICDISTTYISFSSTLRCNPFKILYKTPNKPYKGMYKFLNFDLASPSIDHSIKFSDSLWYARENKIEVLLYICVSTLLWVIHLNVYTISTVFDIL